MIPHVGIMQGRLSPPWRGRIQSFPAATWREEFARARTARLSHIEWIYERETQVDNPLATDAGIEEIRVLSQQHGVAVFSICADYFMTARLVSDDGSPRAREVWRLGWLLERAGRLGARYVVLPFVDGSSLRSAAQVAGLHAVLQDVLPAAERSNVELHLETDLESSRAETILRRASHPLVRWTYDIGNSASLGRDPDEEISRLGRWLGSVHVKDRLPGGETVPLGTGAADFRSCFRLIRAAGFHGRFTLQAAREDGMSEVDLAIRNRRFVEQHVAAAPGN